MSGNGAANQRHQIELMVWCDHIDVVNPQAADRSARSLNFCQRAIAASAGSHPTTTVA
jgi:hypothetical protein